MRQYSIDLPHHVLHFSLPEEMAREMAPTQVESRFSPEEASFLKNDFREIAKHLHDYKGPFWVGAYGSLNFSVMIIKRVAYYQEEIITLPGLDRYVREWIAREARGQGYSCNMGMVDGKIWVTRLQNTFGLPPSPKEPNAVDLIVYAQPLDKEMFLEVGFGITEWVLGSAKKWKKKAEDMRQTIMATVVLDRKTTP